MPEPKEKHLELIQGVVNRMAANSFQLKGWTVTLIAALFALTAAEDRSAFVWVALVPATAFWGLDGYFLRQERLFRRLYDLVRKGGPSVSADGPFTMNTQLGESSDRKVPGWLSVTFSRTLLGFYLPLVLVVAGAGLWRGRGTAEPQGQEAASSVISAEK